MPDNQEIKRNPDGTYKKGCTGNPAGRPKGKTLKEWLKDRMVTMTDDEREAFLEGLSKDLVWRMAEGNPITKLSGDNESPITVKLVNYGDNNTPPIQPESIPASVPEK